MKRGQAAFEYLTTFGWVFLVIVVIIAGLAYFGFLSPSKFLPERCYFSSQLVCDDYRIVYQSAASSNIDMQLRNNFVKDIEIVRVEGVDPEIPINPTCYSINVDIGIGKVRPLSCVIDARLFRGDKTSIPLAITFRRNDSASAPNHTVSGEVFAVVS